MFLFLLKIFESSAEIGIHSYGDYQLYMYDHQGFNREQPTSRPTRREGFYPSPTPYLPVLSSFVPLWVPENTAVENETYWAMEAEPEGGGDDDEDDDEDDDDWEKALPPYQPPPPPQED